jgi:7-dehydrocholesterol reductase
MSDKESWAEDRPGGAFGGLFRSWLLPAIVIVSTPPMAIAFWMMATVYDGSVWALISTFESDAFVAALPRPSWEAARLLFAWSAVQAALLVALPGKRFFGPPSPDGERPLYRENGVLTWIVTHAILGMGWGMGWLRPAVIYDLFGELLITSSLFAVVFCAGLYLYGAFGPSRPDAGTTGNPLWDYWNGVELHPTAFGIQLKQLFNCRIAMMGWSVLLLCFLAKQIELRGALEPAMAVCVGLQVVYIFKFFWWETGYFATLDITHDRFGFYLCWGVMAWLPALYTLAGFYLVENPSGMGWPVGIAVAIFGLAAIAANYAADEERQRVRSTGGQTIVWGKPPVLIQGHYTTADGEQRTNLLLASGWWGRSRHFNYVAELSLAAAWTLPAGFSHLLPWAYVIFLTILLTDRARRDERRCAAKYGAAWDEYCAAVRWRMIPGIW